MDLVLADVSPDIRTYKVHNEFPPSAYYDVWRWAIADQIIRLQTAMEKK